MVRGFLPAERSPRAAVLGACLGVCGCSAWAAFEAPRDRFGGLSLVLLVAAVAAGFGAVTIRGRTRISATFLVCMLAATFLGPASAFLTIVASELTIAWRHRVRPQNVAINLFGNGVFALTVATIFRAVAPHQSHTLAFYLTIALLALGGLAQSWLIVGSLASAFDQTSSGDWSLTDWRALLPTILIDIVLSVSGAAIYVRLGLPGIVFALVAIFTFSYQAHLVAKAEQRAEQYVSLSWGVLAGLMRALDIRDQRAARHAAAVARFARDIAGAVGMSAAECELAHTAGLLHDIGRFALSDRVAERGRTLTDDDWTAIQRHPDLGAEILKDLGIYGPVAEIVRSHHERIDGLGYPRRLPGPEIPPIARIIAVAEVYDTLTASDTYRTRMSSFEALRELRRVAGTQLDGDYVEALATLLGGEGVAYRHADLANFDQELGMERRIGEAAPGSRGPVVRPNESVS